LPLPTDQGELKAYVAAVLAVAYRRTDDPCYRTAAAVVRAANPGGRPAQNDDASLAAMAEMLNSGMAESVNKAARMTARSLPGKHSEDAATQRLARKFGQSLHQNGF
jgi:hypothetical protein